jgi:hypothetical protein
MTQIPNWFSSTDDRAEEKINEIIDYLTARQELEDQRYKDINSRLDVISTNQLEMKRGEKPEPYLPQMCWCGEVDCLGAEVEVGGKVHRPNRSCFVVCEKDQPKRWRAEVGSKYWWVSWDGDVLQTEESEDDSRYDNWNYAIGNYHPTREAAEAYKAKLLADNQQ